MDTVSRSLFYLPLKNALHYCDSLKDKRSALRAFLIGAENALFIYANWKNGEQFVGTCGTKLSEAIKDLVEVAQKFQSEIELERYSQEEFKPIALYEETEDGSSDSKCCGNCEAFGGRIELIPNGTTFCGGSYCWKFRRNVCAANGTCSKFKRK